MTAISRAFHGVDRRRRRLVLLAVPLVLVALFFAGWWPRHAAKVKLAEQTKAIQQTVPRVKVTTAVAAEGGRSLTLPGTLQAYEQALVNARATGYVARWRVDIGDHVRAGDVLAVLETPELDQQLSQARAALKQKEAALRQAVANLDYAKVTARREDALLAEALSSQ